MRSVDFVTIKEFRRRLFKLVVPIDVLSMDVELKELFLVRDLYVFLMTFRRELLIFDGTWLLAPQSTY